MHVRPPRPAVLVAALALLVQSACGGGSGGGGPGGGGGSTRVGAVQGRLAAPGAGAGGGGGGLRRLAGSPALSLASVSVELVSIDASGATPVETVVATATPDVAGAFAFASVKEGRYSLRVKQPEFASVAYGVDSTDLLVNADQTIHVVLPLITTVVHGFVDPTAAAILPPIALDRATGEVVLVTPAGLAIVDPDKGTVDALRSQSLFDGVARVVLPPTRGLLWILYADRIVRIDRSVFTDPDASETIDLEDAAARAAVGDKVRYRLLPPPTGYQGFGFTGQAFFSPDEQVLFASTGATLVAGISGSVAVIDLAQLRLLDDVPGQLAGYNPASNQLFLQARGPGRDVTISVVDATTRFDVMTPFTVESFQGLSPFHGSTRTLLLGSQLNTSSVEIPFVTAVDRNATDGSGVVATPWTRAKDWLGAAADPVAAPPAFDAAGSYLTVGDAAFRILSPSGFQEVTGGIPPGNGFLQGFGGCIRERAVDTTNLYRLWVGCSTTTPIVGLVSLDQANVPIAVRPSVDSGAFLLDEARGRAVFRGDRQLVLVHYADPAATGRAEKLDLSAVVAPWLAPGAPCNDSTPCAADEICLAPTYTSGSGRCTPNPRLPYRPLCGGFGDLACDPGFSCGYVNMGRHQMGGSCTGLPSRDYAASGPACGAGATCPPGMACASGRCAPKGCVRDADCAGPGELCGLVPNLGRACLVPGSLPDGAHCLGSAECAHGACVPIESGALQWSGAGPNMVGDAYGYRGLMACTTPCFQQSECPAGSACQYRAPASIPADAWSAHRVPLAAACTPPEVPPQLFDCAASCGPQQLCRTSGGTSACHVGYSPETGAASGTVCLPPAVPSPTAVGCAFRCDRSGDCPWAATCSQGACAPEGALAWCASCGAAESCVRTGAGGTQHACAALESCFAQGDCASGSCIADACYATACTTNADCVAAECVRFTLNFDPGPPATYTYASYCAPQAPCGCAGAGEVCDFQTLGCVPP
jgi:hypothetical protein